MSSTKTTENYQQTAGLLLICGIYMLYVRLLWAYIPELTIPCSVTVNMEVVVTHVSVHDLTLIV